MSLEFLITVCVSNALWAAVCIILVINSEKERDKLTQKILSKNLTEYALVQERIAKPQKTEEEAAKPFVPEKQRIIPLSEVEKDPYLLEQFSNAVTKNLNKL